MHHPPATAPTDGRVDLVDQCRSGAASLLLLHNT